MCINGPFDPWFSNVTISHLMVPSIVRSPKLFIGVGNLPATLPGLKNNIPFSFFIVGIWVCPYRMALTDLPFLQKLLFMRLRLATGTIKPCISPSFLPLILDSPSKDQKKPLWR